MSSAISITFIDGATYVLPQRCKDHCTKLRNLDSPTFMVQMAIGGDIMERIHQMMIHCLTYFPDVNEYDLLYEEDDPNNCASRRWKYYRKRTPMLCQLFGDYHAPETAFIIDVANFAHHLGFKSLVDITCAFIAQHISKTGRITAWADPSRTAND